MTRDLEALFAPRSVAVVGASLDPNKWGNWLALAALEGADRRDVHLVNRRGGAINGHACIGSLADAGGDVECVVVAVPEALLETAVDDSLAQGAKALIVITAGLGERGDEGRDREQALTQKVRAAGAVMLGPNCIGVYDSAASFRVGSNTYADGSLGLISQSGNLSIEASMLCERAGIGFSRFASVGNQADVGFAALIEHLAQHTPTAAIAIYAEDVGDGRAFVEAARAATAIKPVILLNSGRSPAGSRGAASHTGALTSDDAIVAAACRAAGVIRVDSPGALVDAASAVLRSPRLRGRRLAVIADGGGHGSVAADLASAAGFDVPAFSPQLTAAIAAEMRVEGGVGNPVDLVDGRDGLASFTAVIRHCLASGEVDGAILSGYFGGYAVYSDGYRESEPRAAAAMADLQSDLGLPVVIHSMFADEPSGAALLERLPTYARIEQAVGALSALATPDKTVHLVPGTNVTNMSEAAVSEHKAVLLASGSIGTGLCTGFTAARELLSASGVPYTDGAVGSSSAEIVAAADRLDLYPCALKAVDDRLLHKSDAGGVVLSLPDADALRAAADDMLWSLAPAQLFVERMADTSEGIELVVGGTRDHRFGPTVLVGLGGIFVETLNDSALALAPIDESEADAMLRSLKGAALFHSVRGRPAVDVAAAAKVLVIVSEVIAAHPEIAELEINPLLVTPTGALALDARILLQEH